MSLSRRQFFLWSFTAGQLCHSRGVLAALVSTPLTEIQQLDAEQSYCLRSWIDTLLPADEDSPAASKLGVSNRIAVKALGKPEYLRLIQGGCRWLDRQSRNQGGKTFTTLDAHDRERVVRLAEQMSTNSLPRMFFEHTLQDAFYFYYANPETWLMLDYPGPPQPHGFMNYTQPPAG